MKANKHLFGIMFWLLLGLSSVIVQWQYCVIWFCASYVYYAFVEETKSEGKDGE